MKTIKLDLDYPEKEYKMPDQKDDVGNIVKKGELKLDRGKTDVTIGLLQEMFGNKYGAVDPLTGQKTGGGMTREQLKMWAKIQKKFESETVNEIEVSDDQFELLWDVTTSCTLLPVWAVIHTIWEEHLSEVKEKVEKEQEGNKE